VPYTVTDNPIGSRVFVDGTTRTVYQDTTGRQYVLDDGQRVYGVWLLLPPRDRNGKEEAVAEANRGRHLSDQIRARISEAHRRRSWRR
jgi:hypothetical protein